MKICTNCKVKTEMIKKGGDLGDLGDTPGKRGDVVWYECPNCRNTDWINPCCICNKKSTREICIMEENEKLHGAYDLLPGLPDYVHLCNSQECRNKLGDLIVLAWKDYFDNDYKE